MSETRGRINGMRETGMSPEATLTFVFLGQNAYELKPKEEMHGGVPAARTAHVCMYGDLVSRWTTNFALPR